MKVCAKVSRARSASVHDVEWTLLPSLAAPSSLKPLSYTLCVSSMVLTRPTKEGTRISRCFML